MKAPTADYSPLSQALSAKTSAIQSGYAAKDAGNWQSRYKIQEESIDLQKEAVKDSKIQNYISTGLQLTQQIADFGYKMYNLKATAQAQSIPGKTSQYQSDLAKEAARYEMEGKELWEVGEDGQPRYNADFQQYADTRFEELFGGKQLSTVSKEVLDGYKQSALSAVQESTLGTWMQKQSDMISFSFNENITNAQEAFFSAPDEVGVSRFEFDDGMGGTTEYEVPSNMVSIINARADLDSDEKQQLLIELSKQVKAGKVVYDSQSVFNATGDYDQAKTVLDEGLASTAISQNQYDTELVALQQRNQRNEYNVDQTMLNAGIKMYQKNGDLSYLEKWYKAAYPDLANDPSKLSDLLTQVQSYADQDTNRNLSVAKSEIAKAVESGNMARAESLAKSIPGYSLTLNQYKDSLLAIKDDQTLSSIEKELEQYAMQSKDGAEGALSRLEEMYRRTEVTPSQYTALKTTLTAWSDASHVVSKTQQQNRTALTTSISNELDVALDKAITGSDKDALAYLAKIQSRDPELYGGKAALQASNDTLQHDMWLKRTEYQAGEILKSEGKAAAKEYINNEKHILTTDKKALIDGLDASSSKALSSASTQASEDVAPLKGYLSSGDYSVTDMMSEILKSQPIIEASASSIPEDYRHSYTGKSEQEIISSWNSGYAKIKARALNGNNPAAEVSALKAELDSISATAPNYMQQTLLSAKTELQALTDSWETTYGSANTAQKKQDAAAIVQAISNGEIDATAGLELLYNSQGISIGADGYVTDGSGSTESTASSLITFGNAAQDVLKQIKPDWKSDPALKNFLEVLLPSSLYGDGTSLKDITDQQMLTNFYLAERQYMDECFNYVVRYQLEEKSTGRHSNYTTDQLYSDLTNAMKKYNATWVENINRPTDTNNAMKSSSKTVSSYASEGMDGTGPGVSVTGTVGDKGFVPYTEENLTFSDEASRKKWNDAVTRIGMELNASDNIASIYRDKESGEYVYIPAGISTDGKTLFYALAGGRSEILAYNTETRRKSYLDVDSSFLTENQFKNKVGGEVAAKASSEMADDARTGGILGIVQSGSSQKVEYNSDGTMSYVADDGTRTPVDFRTVDKAEAQFRADAKSRIQSSTFEEANSYIGTISNGMDESEVISLLDEAVRNAGGTVPSEKNHNTLTKDKKIYSYNLEKVEKQIEEAKTYQEAEKAYVDGYQVLKDSDRVRLAKILRSKKF